MQNRTLIIILSTFFLTGCYTRAYYISPMYGKTTPFYTLPMQKDSISSAVYLNGTIGQLSTNHTTRDNVWDVQGTLYRTHNFKFLKIYYGAGGSLGNFNVARITDSVRRIPYYLDTAKINSLAGNYFFGSFGFTNGFHIAFGDDEFEMRLIGGHFALQKEIGDYASFRNQLKKDSVSGLVKDKTLASFSISTGFVAGIRSWKVGISFSETWILGNQYSRTGHSSEIEDSHRYKYFTSLWYVTHKKTTYYLQSSFGDRLVGIQGGINYQLSKK